MGYRNPAKLPDDAADHAKQPSPAVTIAPIARPRVKKKKWLRKRLLAIALAGSAAFLSAWWAGVFAGYLWGPEQVALWLHNVRQGALESVDDRFRVVLCWLENDPDGDNTRHVALAFTSVEGIALVRHPSVVAASGAAGDWREAMQTEARLVLEDSNADLAVVGLVREPGKALSLWFVPRWGEGTLSRGDEPYELDNAALGPDFRDDLSAELTAVALVAVAPLAETETRGRVLVQGLRDSTEKLATLLEDPAAIEPDERRARLQLSLGSALLALGERESGTERLERALEAYRAALEEYTRERVPLGWAATQNNLGSALLILGQRESGTKRLEQSVEAYRAALEERTRERVPLGWAATQDNLGATLQTLGERESGTERLEQAVDAHRAALEERTRERVPLEPLAKRVIGRVFPCRRRRGEGRSAGGMQRSQDGSDRAREAGDTGVHGACLPVMRASAREERWRISFTSRSSLRLFSIHSR